MDAALARALESVRALDGAAVAGRARGELDALFDALIVACAGLSDDQLSAVRDAYANRERWARHEMWMAEPAYLPRFRDGGVRDPRDLERALALYAFDDGAPDMRDALVAIAEIDRLAREHGVDLEAARDRIATIASPEDRSGFGAMRRHLRW